MYAPWLAEAAASIYTESESDPSWASIIQKELERNAVDPASLLLVVEMVDPNAAATATAPAGYSEAAILLTQPHHDPIARIHEARLVVLYTSPGHRNRGLAAALLDRARVVLAARSVATMRAEVFYGDDSIVGLFERREFERGRMSLRRETT